MKSALVVIDVQNCFIKDRTKNIPTKIARHIKASSYDFILFTEFVNKKNSNFYRLIDWTKCNTSPAIDTHSALKRFMKKEHIFKKTSYSIFKARGFNAFLKKNKIQTLYLCGLDAESCVLASAFEAFDRGYTIKVHTNLIDCGSRKKYYEYTLDVLHANIQKP